MSSFIALKILAQLASPLGVFVSGLVVAAVLTLLGLRRLGRLIAGLAIVQLVVFSFSLTGNALLRPLEDEARAAAAAAPACCYDAIGVPDDRIVMEGKSLNTIENMRETRALVGTAKVALVTSGYHMPRALRLARAAGLNAEAFPMDWQVLPTAAPWWKPLMPQIGAIAASSVAIREHLAWAFDYRSATARP